MEANLSKGSAQDQTVTIGNPSLELNPEQGALLVGSQDAVMLVSLNRSDQQAIAAYYSRFGRQQQKETCGKA